MLWERGWRQGWGAAGGSTCSTRRSTGTARRPGSLARAASATGEDACCKFVKVNNEFGQAQPFSKTPTSSNDCGKVDNRKEKVELQVGVALPVQRAALSRDGSGRPMSPVPRQPGRSKV